MIPIIFNQGEQRILTFVITLNNRPFPALEYCLLGLEMRQSLEQQPPQISKVDADFDRSQQASGVVAVALTTADLSEPGYYYGQLAILDSSGQTRKSWPFEVIIKEAYVWKVYNLITNIQVVTTTPDDVELDID